MTSRSDDWNAVGDAVERLALKLKLHAEQAAGDSGDSLKAAADNLGNALEQAFDALRAAATDDAIKEDVRAVATHLKDTVTATLSAKRS